MNVQGAVQGNPMPPRLVFADVSGYERRQKDGREVGDGVCRNVPVVQREQREVATLGAGGGRPRPTEGSLLTRFLWPFG